MWRILLFCFILSLLFRDDVLENEFVLHRKIRAKNASFLSLEGALEDLFMLDVAAARDMTMSPVEANFEILKFLLPWLTIISSRPFRHQL